MNHNKAIIRELEGVTAAGRRRDEVFDDWIDVSLATMGMLPRHLKSAITEKKLAPDDEATAKVFADKERKYEDKWGRYVQKHFATAFHLLLESACTEDGSIDYRDSLGEMFQEFGHPNTWAGQFMTPMPIALAMAKMVNVEELVRERMKEAMMASPIAQALGFAGLVLADDCKASVDWFLKRVLPAIAEDYKPVTVCDPCCGSGVMFLATAASCPVWMSQSGLIHFYGADIDNTCVKMSRLNLMLYGCNGYAIQCAFAMSDVDLDKLPVQVRDLYAEARKVPPDEPEKLQEFRRAINADKRGQLQLL